jgi:hypothetical protein
VTPTVVEKVRLVGERAAAGAVAVPLKLTVCGLPLALSVMVSVPVTVPALVAVNVTLIVQLAPPARLVPQVLVWAKLALGETVMLEMLSEPFPESVTVTVCAALATPTVVEKVRLLSDSVTAGAVAVPVKLTVCGLLLALSVMVSVPATVPALAEVNVTLIVQLAPAARLEPQVLVWVKLALGETVMLEMVREAFPELVSVTV